jgi:hypothetical protein
MCLRTLCFLLFSIILVACSSTEKTAKPEAAVSQAPRVQQESVQDEEHVSSVQTIADAKVIGGNSEVSACEVVATILEVYDELEADPSNLCGQYPCFALIRIDQVVKMGQLCSPAIVPGANLKAFFKITLSKTDNIFPDMKQHFPGLEKYDTFGASFMTTGDTEYKYHVVINAYTKAE